MALKLICKGKAGRNVLIGTGVKGEDVWYSITDKVRPSVDKIQPGTEVTIVSEEKNKSNLLYEIYEVGKSNGVAEVKKPTPLPKPPTPRAVVAEATAIKDQATSSGLLVGQMAATSMSSMAGFITPENFEAETRKAFALFRELVSE